MIAIDTGTPELLCEVSDGVATLTLNRPEKRNALSDRLTPALRAVLPLLDAREDVRVVVLTGAGRAFCAGGDVSEMGGGSLAADAERTFERKLAELIEKQRTLTLRLYELATPTVAALPGAAAGAGFSIALACDLRLAAASAFVTTGFGNIGLSGDYGASWLLGRLVGPAIAKDLFFTGRRVGAEEGLRLGIFNATAADEDFAMLVDETARRIAAGPPIALRYMKQHLNRAADTDLASCLAMEAEHLLRCAQTDDHREAVQAFLDKRPPEFRGR
ncbi:MAG: enoyl-CoA hydratase-related protein [Gammaproteobacteria bacterium]